MKRILSVMVLFAMAFVVLSMGTIAVYVPTGVNITLGSTDNSVTPSNLTISSEGGNVSELNITQRSYSTNWAVFVGEIDQNVLFTGSANTIYDWGNATVSENAYIFFANTSNIAWASVAAGDANDAKVVNADLGIGTATDNLTNTFGAGTHTAVNLTGNVIAANSAVTFDTLSNGGTNWATVLLMSGEDVIYGGEVLADNENYAGNTDDYQIMVPTGASAQTYYVYAGLP